MLINFAYNPNLVNKPPVLPQPVHRIMWARINGTFVNKRGTPRTLAGIIKKGHPYTSVHTRYRHERNFTQGSVLSLDFDHGNCSFDALMEDSFIKQYASFMYSTPSSTPEHPRTRVVFVLSKPVSNSIMFGLMARSLVEKYTEEADSTCKDPVRIFFGSKDCELKYLSNILPYDLIADMAEITMKQEIVKRQKTARELKDAVNISNETALEIIKKQLDKIVTAADGSRHNTRISVARTIGGYVAAGYIDYPQAEAFLFDAATSNTSSPVHAVTRDIQQGLIYGMSSPLVIPPSSFADYGIEI